MLGREFKMFSILLVLYMCVRYIHDEMYGAGVNILNYSRIFHPGKVSLSRLFTLEFKGKVYHI